MRAQPRSLCNWSRHAPLAALALGAAACGSGCGSQRDSSAPRSRPGLPSEYQVPARAPTAGDALLAMAPPGADVVVELDLARLRANPVVGPVVEELGRRLLGAVAGTVDDSGASSTSADDWLRATEAVLLCAYHVGQDSAVTVTLIRGSAPLGERLDGQTSVLASGEWVARVRSVRAGETPPLSEDRALMRIRTQAMPERAEGGFLRAAARLSFQARVELASRLDLDAVPATVSLWSDVADDFALVTELRGTEPQDGVTLERSVAAALEQLVRLPWIRARYLHFTLRAVDISAHLANARVLLVIGPQRLRNLIARVMRSLAKNPHDLDDPAAQPRPESL